MQDHPFGVWSVVPPVVAIGLAILTRRVVISLLLGVVAAAAIIVLHDVDSVTIANLPHLVWDNLCWPILSNLTDWEHEQVFVFTLAMGAMVGVMHRSGGMHGVVDSLAPWASNHRRGQLVTWALGMVIFFDDYANTLLLGGTMRPLADRLRISREKLAYLVDSTAAPVAGLAVISTWVAGEIGFIQDGFQNAQFAGEVDGMNLFVATIPYRFYVLLALVFVAMVAASGRDFGAMLAAEQRTRGADPKGNETPKPQQDDRLTPDPNAPHHGSVAVVPIVITVAGILAVLVYSGAQQLANQGVWQPNVVRMIAAGDSYFALVCASAAGLASAALLTAGKRLLSARQILASAAYGAWLMVPALLILWMAWTLADLTGEGNLRAGEYLAGLVGESVRVEWMPTVVFVLAAVVSFATGTSWGTMGIVMPLAIAVTLKLLSSGGEIPASDDPLLLATIASVLAGAIFGDHCSPVSDTTILSSHACGCDHMAHVWTQMPYALVVGSVAILCGTLPAGYGASPWLLLPIGCLTLMVLLRVFGRQTDSIVEH